MNVTKSSNPLPGSFKNFSASSELLKTIPISPRSYQHSWPKSAGSLQTRRSASFSTSWSVRSFLPLLTPIWNLMIPMILRKTSGWTTPFWPPKSYFDSRAFANSCSSSGRYAALPKGHGNPKDDLLLLLGRLSKRYAAPYPSGISHTANMDGKSRTIKSYKDGLSGIMPAN